MRWCVASVLFLLPLARCLALAQETAPEVVVEPRAATEIKLLHTEIDAVSWTFNALTKYPPSDTPYLRFVYMPPWADKGWIGAMDVAVNSACSQTSVLQRADLHAGGWLLAYNLQRLAPKKEQLARLIETWDSLAARDPVFHLPQVNIREIEEVVTVNQRDPTTGQMRQVRQRQRRKVQREIFVLAPHLSAALAKHVTTPAKSKRIDLLVTQLTQSTGAIYPADFLLEQLLTSLRGKYPEFRQMDFQVARGTPFANLLKKRGFFFDQSQDSRGDKGALILISEVTGKNRLVFTVFGLVSRRPLAVTFDFKDNRTRPDEQFVRNVIEFEALSDASEAFIPLPNGMLEYVLADAQGNLQRSAPPDVVADSTKPDGHTKELEMGMSCVVCHSPGDGYRTANNDMEFLLGADTDFFGDDFSYTDRAGTKHSLSRDEAVEIVASRYGEPIDEPDGILGRARRDYIRAVDTLTDYKIDDTKLSSVQRVGLKIKEIYHNYRYRTFDAEAVCLQLGVRVPEGQGRAVLKKLVPPPPRGQREDILISLLRNGAKVKRDDLDAIYGTLAQRSVQNRPTLLEQLNNEQAIAN